MGKKCDFECHNIEHQLGAYTDCNHGCGLAVLHPIYYRHIYKAGLSKFVKFAGNVWGIATEGKSAEEIALAGINALAKDVYKRQILWSSYFYHRRLSLSYYCSAECFSH